MLINLIIIYFACGSPIGIYRIARATQLRSPLQAAAVGVYFILWPIFAPAILRRSLFSDEEKVEHAISAIRGAIEDIAFADRPTISVFEFREIFSRYTGLTLSLRRGRKAQFPTELFTAAGHENLELASVCLDRVNRRRLAFHQERARNEFVDLMVAISRSGPRGTEIVALGFQIAKLLEDKETTRLIGKSSVPDLRSVDGRRLAA